ncbi:Hint domain-containing protein [Phaeobacter sp. J2-8]|uniref:Hint domain-containing protein n=1 Tax=Phaeobacter sp. J2-8 TaxID=2931394 RepID=UPI001FD2FE75|nr:Hint domain-containing protein [Phaeobacter sp. J2-8]MCJ7871553.1 Hint domain-containing protein [Phaeobacter sp. J2-8]
MPLSFTATNSEFSTATGSNIGRYGTSSAFDGPPSETSNLQVTANSGDSDPRLFEIGDSYDVQFDGPGGPVTIEDAVVVRSDNAPGEAGIVVLSGQDQNGVPVEVLWTPSYNLQGWYDAASGTTSRVGFFNTDRQATYDHEIVCFAAETAIVVKGGPIAAEKIAPGQLVRTLDAGLQPVKWVGHKKLPGIDAAAPVVFAPGTIGNDATLRLSQQHRVMIRSARAELLFDTPEVLVPAKALVNGHSIRIRPCDEITYIHLLLEDHHILRAEGALCESLLLGDQSRDILQMPRPVGHAEMRPARRILRPYEACGFLPAAAVSSPNALFRGTAALAERELASV